jgi:hypothetical protein
MREECSGEGARGGDERPLRAPDAACEGCGARGTVGRASRWRGAGQVVVEEHRYCGRCWPEWSAFYQARWEEEDRVTHEAWVRWTPREPDDERPPPPPPSGMLLGALTWRASLQLVREVERALRRGASEVSEATLAEIATQMAAGAADCEGPVPLEVEDFIRRYAGREQAG